jgi:hypothetical protein
MVIESTRTTLPPSIVYTYLLQKRSKKYLATREDIRIFTIMDDKELEEIGMTREEWDMVKKLDFLICLYIK